MLARRLTAVIPPAAAIIVAAASFTLSFVALRDVSADVQAVPASLAWLVPIVVDGGILAASASLWASSYRQVARDKVAYVIVVVLLGFSVVVNASHAGPTVLAKAIAALPPIVLLATLELVAAAHRRQLLSADEPAARTVSGTADQSFGQSSGFGQPASSAAGAAFGAGSVELAPVSDSVSEGDLLNKGASRTEVVSGCGVVESDSPEPVRSAAAAGSATKRARNPQRKSSSKAPSRASEIRDVFDELVLAGMDPSDPKMASTIAERLDVTPAYVRRLIRPLREDSLPRSSAVSAPAPPSVDA